MDSPLLKTWQLFLGEEMTEKPYNDEEFEKLKKRQGNRNKPRSASMHPDAQRTIDQRNEETNRLIVTIEADRQLNEMLIEGQLDLTKEVESLKGSFQHGYAKGIKMNPLEDDWVKLEEEVKNWKDAVHDYSVALEGKEKENAKLKSMIEHGVGFEDLNDDH